MNLSQLRYLVAAADHATMTAASQALHVSQPVLSRAIRAFEREIGVEVFTRSGRNVVLTAGGRAVVEHARRVLEALAPLHDLAQVAREDRHVLQVAGTSTLAMSLGRRTAAALQALGCETRLRFMRAEDIQDVFGMVATSKADVGLTDTKPDGDLVWHPVAESEGVLVTAASVQLPDPMPVARLPEVPMILPTRAHRRRAEIDDYAHSIGVKLTVSVETDDRSAWAALAADGLGGFLTYLDAVTHIDSAGMRIHRLEPRPVRTVGVIHRPNEGHRGQIREFVRAAQHAGDEQAGNAAAGWEQDQGLRP